MMHLKMLAAAVAVVGGLGLATADAAPLTPISSQTIAGTSNATNVAYGCPPGFVPRRYGPGCRPFGGYGYGYGPRRFYGGGYGYGPRPYYGPPRRFYY